MGIRILAIIVASLLLVAVGFVAIDKGFSIEMLPILGGGLVFLAYGVGGPKLIERLMPANTILLSDSMVDDPKQPKSHYVNRGLSGGAMGALLIAFFFLSFIAGVNLGQWSPTARLAIWPNPTPIGNWVIFLIGLSVTALLFFDHAGKTGKVRVRLPVALTVTAFLSGLLLAGTTGFLIIGIFIAVIALISKQKRLGN